MAQLPLNTFKTKTKVLGTDTGTHATVYTAPIGVTSIILMAQISNLDTSTHTVNFFHYRNRPVLADSQGNGAQSGRTASPLVVNFAIPPADAGSPLAGKMILEQLDSIQAYSDTTSTLQLVLSVLETANA
jgi:hypothetical protein